MKTGFTLWLELEEYADPYPGEDDNPLCDFCNAVVTVEGSRYAINIWTFAFVEVARRSGDDGLPLETPASYLLPPDLLVERLDRATIEHAIGDLMGMGELPANWRVPHED